MYVVRAHVSKSIFNFIMGISFEVIGKVVSTNQKQALHPG